MNRFLSVIVLCCIFFTGFSQNTLDSLVLVLKKNPAPDTTRCFLLDNIVYLEEQSEVWIIYNNELKQISKTEFSKKQKSNAIKKAYGMYYARALNNESVYWSHKGNKQKAILIVKQAAEICGQNNDSAGLALAYHNISNMYDGWGKKDSVIPYLKKAIDMYESQGNREDQIFALIDLSTAETENGDIDKGLKVAFEALGVSEKENLYVGIDRSSASIAYTYKTNGDYESAIKYYHKALEAAKKINSLNRMSYNYARLANCYLETKDEKKFIEYNRAAENIAAKEGIIANLVETDFNWGNYYENKNTDSAYYYYYKSYAASKEYQLLKHLLTNCSSLSDILIVKKDYKNAEKYSLEGIELTKGQNYPTTRIELAKNLIEIYTALGEYSKLPPYYQIVFEQQEILFKDENRNSLLKREYTFQAEKKEAAIKQLKQQNEIAQLQSQRKSIILYSTIGGFAALTLIGYFFFTRYKTRKQNELLRVRLDDAERLLELEKKASESEIKAIKSQMNPHFFYNALNSIQGFIYTGEKEKAARSLGIFSDLSRAVLESSRNEEISLHDEMELLENYLKLETMRLPRIKYEIYKQEELPFYDIYIPSMIIQPLVENAIKHGLANKEGSGKLYIRFTKEENKLIISIDDDGVGRKAAAELAKRLSRKSASFSTDANLNRIELLNANKSEKIVQQIIDKTDEQGNSVGTLVKLTIPLNEND